MIRAVAFILALLFAGPALAQGCGASNPNCVVPTPPTSDSSNRAANTSWVRANAVNSINGRTGAIIGVDTNTLNAQAGNYTIASSDCGTVILASGGMNTITLPSTSGFPVACIVTVKNNETYTGSSGRGKIMSGFPGDALAGGWGVLPGSATHPILWPLQVVKVGIENGSWITIQPSGLWLAPTVVTLHVDRTFGSDLNDCLAATTGACATPAGAYFVSQLQINANRQTNIIALACGETFITELNMEATNTGSNLIQLSPDGNCSATWSVASGPCIAVGDLAMLDLNLTYYGASGAITFGCNGGNASQTGNIYLHNYAVLDLEGTPLWQPSGGNDNFLYCDGLCIFTIANGFNQNGGGTGNYGIYMAQGGKGTFSGGASNVGGGGGTLSGVFHIFGGALLIRGTSDGGGWGSIGSSLVEGHATYVTNSTSTTGGVTVGASGVSCTTATGSC